ncbi:MAG TPA: hypothetical protein VIT45_12590 [Allosphingosinicella sp.]
MTFFDGNSARMRHPGRGRFAVSRGEAEAFAASLGLTPGGPGWGDAIRDFVVNGPAARDVPGGAMLAAEGDDGPALRHGPMGLGPSALPAAPLPDRRGPPILPTNPQSPKGDPEGIRQFFGGQPGEARDPSLGGRLRESQDDIRGILAPGARQIDLPRAHAAPEPGGRPVDRVSAARARPARLPGGGLSAREETGGRGPGTVSTGVNDPGGISYGSYQLSSNRGQVQAFLRSDEGSRWSRELQGAAPGTREFQRRWQQIAARDPDAFHGAQHDFIGRTHYTPAVTAVRRNTGVDLDSMPEAVRDAAWSASVQHGTAAQVLTGAVERADDRVRQGSEAVDRSSPLYQEALIEEMYDGRTALLTRLINSPRTSAGDRSTFRGIIANRYPRERAAALRQLREGQGRTGGGE